MHSGLDGAFFVARRGSAVTGKPLGDKPSGVELAQRDVLKSLPQAIVLGGIELQGPLWIGEHESIEDQALRVRERLGLKDVHSKAGEPAGQGREQSRAVARNDG